MGSSSDRTTGKLPSQLTPASGLARFVPKSDPSKVLPDEPGSDDTEVGAALWKGDEVADNVFSGT